MSEGARAASPPTGKPARAWQRMLSGRRLDLLDPSPLDIEIEDIAHGLARVARWNGQTRGAHIFSVAQHSLLVEAIARQSEPDLAAADGLQVLLHDAAEFVIGDIISPFKAVLGDAYRGVEHRILAAVRLRFGLPPVPGRRVAALTKQSDRVAAHWEATELAGFSPAEAREFFGARVRLPADVQPMLTPWPAETAASRFQDRFHALIPPLAANRPSSSPLP